MSKTFRPWTIDQPLLLPPSVQDFVGEDHLARFILALVLEHLDLGEIEAAYASERGQPPFDPAIKQARGFRQFLLRGVEKVANEWGLVCLAHNILKLAQGRTPSLAALATG